jgi:hypothetical protein
MYYSKENLNRLLDAPTSRKRANLHKAMFNGGVPDDRIGEAVHMQSLSKNKIVRAAVWDSQGSQANWLAPYILKHTLPWVSDDEYGDAVFFAFTIISDTQQKKSGKSPRLTLSRGK